MEGEREDINGRCSVEELSEVPLEMRKKELINLKENFLDFEKNENLEQVEQN